VIAFAHYFRYTALIMTSATESRRGIIVELLARDGFIEVAELQRHLHCSEATIRRDLEELQRTGHLRRTHGGAVAENPRELPFTMKIGERAEEKFRIGRASAALVLEGAAVGFTGGTTTQQIARALTGRSGITAVTNAINIAMELASEDIRVIVIGGELRGQTYELVGPLAEPVLGQLHLDIMFVGVDGFSINGGLTTHNPSEARINWELLSRANRVVVVTDHTKLTRSTFARIAPFDAASTLITDVGASPQVLEEMRATGLEIIVA
jgi:DeoR family transcriptional regulator, aga operon transcriptional repressor